MKSVLDENWLWWQQWREIVRKGILAESLVNKDIKCFVSLVDSQSFFGYERVFDGEILTVEECMDFHEGVQKVIDHALCFQERGQNELQS